MFTDEVYHVTAERDIRFTVTHKVLVWDEHTEEECVRSVTRGFIVPEGEDIGFYVEDIMGSPGADGWYELYEDEG